ncbi:hypothetical protein AcV7_009492 [Taiwanofungus camphoratus]|nr:hypothetical protein AcV7_009492 [Antrodia cinnamomea]
MSDSDDSPLSPIDEQEEYNLEPIFTTVPAFEQEPTESPVGLSKINRIEFNLLGRPAGVGIQLMDYLMNAKILSSELCDGDECIIEKTELDTIMLRISWPAYPDVELLCPLLPCHPDGRLVTRADLLKNIVELYHDYYESTRRNEVADDVAHLAFSPRGTITFQKLWIVSLDNTADNKFQAQIKYKTFH